MTILPTLGFVGTGKVGYTLARLWYSKGYTVRAVHSRKMADSNALAAMVAAMAVESGADVIQAADITFLTVPDDAINGVVSDITLTAMETNKAVVHTSGALNLTGLSPLMKWGVMTGGLHPIFPFAKGESAITGLPGAVFGVETDSEVLYQWMEALVRSVDGHILTIPEGGRALYHSAFVFASNYVVTLYSIAEGLLLELGAERKIVDQALDMLLTGTVENLRRQGIPEALTGPLVRRDMQTITSHVQALEVEDKDLAEVYKQLGRLSLPMLAARNIDTSFIERLLNRENHASDNP